MLSKAKHLSIPNGITCEERSFVSLRMTTNKVYNYMEWFESHAGLFSFIAAIAAIISIILSIVFYILNSRQSERFYKDWDRKRRYSRDYDAFAEFQDNVRRK